MIKEKIKTIHERNRIADNIINAFAERNSFLICGHKMPDEDCISSMVAVAIILTKFDKMVHIYIDGKVPENINYLLNICKYNSIKIINSSNNLKKNIDTIIICDTAKPSLMDINQKIQKLLKNKEILKIEFDHHTGTDSEYIGDVDYSLVDAASSASELVGFLALKLRSKKSLLNKFFIMDPFSRNFILPLLTGIVGDTNMGQFLKSRREQRYYHIFTKLYEEMLVKITVKETNFSNAQQVFKELKKLSELESKCYNLIAKKSQYSDSIGYIVLNKKQSANLFKEFTPDIIISVSRHIADELAEKSGKLSLLVFYDNQDNSGLIQFRMRRSYNFKIFDLRKVLDMFSITDGGGHEGAIAFRFKGNKLKNINEYILNLIDRVESEIAGL